MVVLVQQWYEQVKVQVRVKGEGSGEGEGEDVILEGEVEGSVTSSI
ncbi:hypothetical protein Tco_0689021, partial [Tanacetum coccineum]